MFLDTATYLAIVRQSLSGLYISVNWVFVSPCIGIWVLSLNNTNSQLIYPDTRCTVCFTGIRSLLLMYYYICIYSHENINNWGCTTEKARYCMVLLLSNVEWNLLTCVIQYFIKAFHFMMELRVTGTWSTCWKYDLLLLIYCLRKAPSCQNI